MLLNFSREQLEAAAGIVMRVPGLFIIDYWWQHDRNKSLPSSFSTAEIFNAAATNLVLFQGFLLLMLPMPQVKTLYTHFISGCIVLYCHLLSGYYVATEKEEDSPALSAGYVNFFRRHLTVLICHVFGALAIAQMTGPLKPYSLALCFYILPVLARLFDLPHESLQILHNFSSAIIAVNVFFYILHQIPSVLDFVRLAYTNILLTLHTHSFMAVSSVLWNKLFVPNHFAVYWLIQFSTKLFTVIHQHSEVSSNWRDEWYILILTTVSSICASPVSLIATSVSVSYLSFFILSGTRAYLLGQLNFYLDNPLHSGWTEGLTLVLLAIQTGLAEIKMPARIAVMTIILFIVLSSLLQSMLEIAEPIVLALSASRSRSFGRHFRAFTLCAGLLMFPLYLTYILSQVFPIDFWLMVVLSSCMLTSVHVIDLFVVHCLFLYDSTQTELWENLDDIVFYTRAITKVLEFFVALFVVAMGVWESVSAKWNYVNASILLVHCYFNVWQRLQTGWRSFLLRREAAKKSESLPSAMEEQLRQLDDVCSICFTTMKSACITPCQHFFHRTCLRKWLYVQDNCPLCHRKVSVPSSSPSS